MFTCYHQLKEKSLPMIRQRTLHLCSVFIPRSTTTAKFGLYALSLEGLLNQTSSDIKVKRAKPINENRLWKSLCGQVDQQITYAQNGVKMN